MWSNLVRFEKLLDTPALGDRFGDRVKETKASTASNLRFSFCVTTFIIVTFCVCITPADQIRVRVTGTREYTAFILADYLHSSR